MHSRNTCKRFQAADLQIISIANFHFFLALRQGGPPEQVGQVLVVQLQGVGSPAIHAEAIACSAALAERGKAVLC